MARGPDADPTRRPTTPSNDCVGARPQAQQQPRPQMADPQPFPAGAATAAAADAAAAHHMPLNPLDLDRLFHEGDDRTWDVEEWAWDSSEFVAAPNCVPTINSCQVRVRPCARQLRAACSCSSRR
jgi:hypothetical protein